MPRKTEIVIYKTPHNNLIVTIGKEYSVVISTIEPEKCVISGGKYNKEFLKECTIIRRN